MESVSRASQGWVRLNRNIHDSDIWEDAGMYQFFSHILMEAEYEITYRPWTDKSGRKRSVRLERGQAWVNQRGLAEKLKTTRKVIRRYLKHLEKTARYQLKTGPFGTIVTVLKYDVYQSGEAEKGPLTLENGPYLKKEKKNTNTGTGKVSVLGKQSGPAQVAPRAAVQTVSQSPVTQNQCDSEGYIITMGRRVKDPLSTISPKVESRFCPKNPHSEFAKQTGPARLAGPKELLYTPTAEETLRQNREINRPTTVTDEIKGKVHNYTEALYRKLREVDEKAHNERRGRHTGNHRLFESAHGFLHAGFKAAYAGG